MQHSSQTNSPRGRTGGGAEGETRWGFRGIRGPGGEAVRLCCERPFPVCRADVSARHIPCRRRRLPYMYISIHVCVCVRARVRRRRLPPPAPGRTFPRTLVRAGPRRRPSWTPRVAADSDAPQTRPSRARATQAEGGPAAHLPSHMRSPPGALLPPPLGPPRPSESLPPCGALPFTSPPPLPPSRRALRSRPAGAGLCCLEQIALEQVITG